MPRTFIAAIALLAFAFATVGCGDDDNSAGSGKEIVVGEFEGGFDKAELAKRAADICTESNPEVKALGEPDLSDLTAARRYFAKRYELSLDLRTDLRDLNPNREVEREWDKVLAAFDKTHNDIGHFISAAKNKDKVTANRAAKTLDKHTDEANRLFDDFGVPECGSQRS